MSNILAIGSDPALLYTRGLVLERTGAQVSRVGPDLAVALLKTNTFDLIVLCHSLSTESVKRIYSEVRASQMSSKLLFLLSRDTSSVSPVEVDCQLLPEDGPKELVRAARRLIEGTSLRSQEPGGKQPFAPALKLFPSRPREESERFRQG